MGFNDGFRMGLTMLDQIASEKQRAQENAWRQQQMDAWQKDQDFKTAERENFLAARNAATSVPQEDGFNFPGKGVASSITMDGSGQYRPAYDSQAASTGTPTESRQSVRLTYTPEQIAQQGLSSKMMGAAGSLSELRALQADDNKQKAFQQGMQLRSYLKSVDDKTFNEHLQDVSDSSRNGYKLKTGKNGYVTVEVDGGSPISLNKDQAIDWITSRYVYNKTGDETALKRIDALDKRLGDLSQESYARAIGMAGVTNTATSHANSDARGATAERRLQQEFDMRKPTLEAAGDIAKLRSELAEVDDTTPEGKLRSDQIQAKLLALSTGMRGVGAGHDPADVIKAKKLVAQGIYPSEGEALDSIVSKPDKLYQTYKDSAMKVKMNADSAMEDAKKMMADDGWVKSSTGTWKRAGAPSGASGIASDPKAIAIRDDKSLTLDQKKSKLAELGYR